MEPAAEDEDEDEDADAERRSGRSWSVLVPGPAPLVLSTVALFGEQTVSNIVPPSDQPRAFHRSAIFF